MVIILGQVGELLEVLDLLDALMPAKFSVKDRKGSRLFKAQVIDLHLILQTSDNDMLQADQGITPLGTRAYLMNVLPHALAKAFPAYVTLNHGYYTAEYNLDIPLDWITECNGVLCLIAMLTADAFRKTDMLEGLQKALPMQFLGSLKTCKQIKAQVAKRYITRYLRAVYEALHPKP